MEMSDAVEVLRHRARELTDIADNPQRWSPKGTGDALATVAVSIAAVADNLATWVRDLVTELAAPHTLTRSAHALEADPYAFEGVGFADVFAVESLRMEDRANLMVRQRILDDVEQAHRFLDNIGTPSGTLSTRIGLALLGVGPTITGPTFTPKIGADEITGLMQHRRSDRTAREPVADLGSVSVPTVDELLPRLLALSGEDVFRIFDRVHVLPGNREAVDGYNLTDETSVRRMIAECCTIAVDLQKLGELAKAVDEHAARAGK